MIRHTFRQLIAMRYHNVWIFAELVVVFVIGAYILDYATNISFNRSLAHGYDTSDVYILDAKLDGEDPKVAQELYIREVRQFPGVQHAMLSHSYALMPNDGGISLQSLEDQDGEFVYSRCTRITDTSYFHILDIRSSITGEVAQMSIDEPTTILTEDLAALFYPGIDDPRGRFVSIGGYQVKISDVVPCIKDIDYGRPGRLFFIQDHSTPSLFPRLIIKTAKQFVRTDFEKRFGTLTSMDDWRKQREKADGITNRLYIQWGISLFFTLNIALAVIGVLWFRTQRRRGEIGIRRALGSSKHLIEWQLVLEPLLLLCMAAIPAIAIGWLIMEAGLLPEVINRENLQEMLTSMDASIPEPNVYWIDNPWKRFAFVQALTLVVLSIVVTISAYLPASLASRVRPVEALQEG